MLEPALTNYGIYIYQESLVTNFEFFKIVHGSHFLFALQSKTKNSDKFIQKKKKTIWIMGALRTFLNLMLLITAVLCLKHISLTLI